MSVGICEKCGEYNPSYRRCAECGWWSNPLTEQELKSGHLRCQKCGDKNLFEDRDGYMGIERCSSCGWISWESICLNCMASILMFGLAWWIRAPRWLFWIFIFVGIIEGLRVFVKLFSILIDWLGQTPFDQNPKQ